MKENHYTNNDLKKRKEGRTLFCNLNDHYELIGLKYVWKIKMLKVSEVKISMYHYILKKKKRTVLM